MKSLIALLILCVYPVFSFAQNSYLLKNDQKPTSFLYVVNNDTIKVKNPVDLFRNDLDKTRENNNKGNQSKDNEYMFSESELNLFFSNKISSGFSDTHDLSLEKYYFNLNFSDNSFALGYNLDFRKGDPLKPLNTVLSIGTKIVANNDFASLANGGDLLEDNILFTLKASLIGDGIIKLGDFQTVYPKNKKSIEIHRSSLFYEYDQKIKKYIKEELPKIVELDTVGKSREEWNKSIKEKMKKKAEVLYYEMLVEDLKYIETKSLYTTASNYWLTMDVTIPLGDKKYNTTPILEDNTATKEQYYAFDAGVSLNYFRTTNKHSLFLKVRASVKGNNTIEVNRDSETTFQSITMDNNVPVLTTPVKAYNIDDYERFVTTTINGELVFLFNKWIGFSPAIEKNFGNYKGLNWKLGIPLTLKGKKSDDRVNFELQWKEAKTMESRVHYFGFSSSVLLDKLVSL